METMPAKLLEQPKRRSPNLLWYPYVCGPLRQGQRVAWRHRVPGLESSLLLQEPQNTVASAALCKVPHWALRRKFSLLPTAQKILCLCQLRTCFSRHPNQS